MNERVKLGAEVRELITGLEGVVVCRSVWLNGCVRITIQPRRLSDGKPSECISFDEQQIEVIAEPSGKFIVKERTGGPTPEPQRYNPPRSHHQDPM